MKLVLVHGMWAGPWCWDRFIPLFREKGWDCLAPCLRGHCGSNGNVGKLSIEDYAGDLEKLAGHFPEKPVVIGHSMGGLLAQILAGRGVVAGAVMLGPASPAGIAPVSAVGSVWSIVSRWGWWYRPARPTLEEAGEWMFNDLPTSGKAKLYGKLVPESGRAMAEVGAWWLWTILGKKPPTAVEAENVSCPMLFIAGSEDRVAPLSAVRAQSALYDGRTSFRTVESSHWLLNKKEVAREVICWLEERFERSALTLFLIIFTVFQGKLESCEKP